MRASPVRESVWPGVRNDLFVAHASIYRRDTEGSGADAEGVRARSIVSGAPLGIDIDARSIRYARRHYECDGLDFRTADIENLDFPARSFDVIVSSNALEHLESPRRRLRQTAVS